MTDRKGEFQELPVPPLPTAPYTVISVTWKPHSASDYDVLVLVDDYWLGVSTGEDVSHLHDAITDFVVLAEPGAAVGPPPLSRNDARAAILDVENETGGLSLMDREVDKILDALGWPS